MKRIFSLFLTFNIIVMLSGCGVSAEKIAATTIKQQELIKLYDSVAPTVAKLDQASVEMYDEIGKTVRKSINAITNDFDGYDNDDIDKLSIDMDSAILSLRSFVGKQPVEIEDNKTGGKLYTISIQNNTGKPLSQVVLKSGSGEHDKKVSISNIFSAEGIISETLNAPESESYTVTAVDTEGTNISFSGSFYIANADNLILNLENDKYLISTSRKAE
ncbi:MAG: hypothetical protein IKJ06_00905 [Clostridia bacterium]|nr:hypothetical protein [Clostridia bacterium]